MKIIFKKTAEGTLSIQLVKGAATIDFTYVDMIKELLSNNQLEESVFEGDISPEEKQKIGEMLQKISESMPESSSESLAV
jgi:hypothetical protein